MALLTSPAVTSAPVTVVNSAPVFGTEFSDRSDAEGALISFDSNAADVDAADTLTTRLPTAQGITINSSTGVVSGTLSGTSSGRSRSSSPSATGRSPTPTASPGP